MAPVQLIWIWRRRSRFFVTTNKSMSMSSSWRRHFALSWRRCCRRRDSWVTCLPTLVSRHLSYMQVLLILFKIRISVYFKWISSILYAFFQSGKLFCSLNLIIKDKKHTFQYFSLFTYSLNQSQTISKL